MILPDARPSANQFDGYGDLLHEMNRIRIVGGQKLPTGGPIDLHCVIGWRIVTGGDHDAAVAFFVSHGERQLGSAAIAIEEINCKAGGNHDLAAQFGEMPGLMPGVVGDGTG